MGYETGRVYRATVRGVEDVHIYRALDSHGWRSVGDVSGFVWHAESDLTDIRGPLVVLDLDNLRGCWVTSLSTADILRALRATNSVPAHGIADQIEAQTKPARIPQPEWGTVVTAGYLERPRTRWQRRSATHDLWVAEDGAMNVPWDTLIDPEVTP